MPSAPRLVVAALAALALIGCSDDGGEGIDLGEHWHVAYDIQVCGESLPPAADHGEDVLGIHSHQDGLIHIHPFKSEATGAGADLGAFLDQIGAELGSDSIELVDGSVPPDGTCDGEEAVVRVAQWDSALDAAEGAAPDRVVTDDLDDIALAPDLSALSIVIGPEDAEINAPASASEICALAVVDGATASPVCGATPPGPTTTGPAATATTATTG